MVAEYLQPFLKIIIIIISVWSIDEFKSNNVKGFKRYNRKKGLKMK